MALGEYSRRAHATKVIDEDRPPSDLFREHIFGCFIDDPVGVRMLDAIGADNVMMEMDYPHSDTTWPDTIRIAHEQLSGCTDDQKRKLLFENAMRVFSFTPAIPPALV
jgi:predicted TIM-barrel fold metal-dependent hydrolase